MKNKRKKKRLIVITISIFFVFTNAAILNLCVNSWQPPPVDLSNKTYEAGIVLGGLVMTDKNNQVYLSLAADRLIKAVELFNQGIIKKIVLTGGSPNEGEPGEAIFLKEELIRCGIPITEIIVEDKSRNTFENAIFAKRILDTAGLAGPLVLITSAMHIPRATRIFQKAGIQVIPFPTNYEVVKEKISFDNLLLPKPRLLDIWARFFKEITGIWVYRLTGKA